MKLYKLIISLFLITSALAALPFENAPTIKLPPPVKTGGPALAEALSARQSSREYSSRELSPEILSNLLWSACGVNRDESGKRTAPTAMNWQDTEVYAALPNGLYLYDHKNHSLILIKKGDIRKLTGKQDFVEKAALNLIYVADLSKMKNASENDKLLYAGIHAGCISQNVSLYCAATGLNTVMRRYVDFDALKKEMALGDEKIIVMCQTVGYKPEK